MDLTVHLLNIFIANKRKGCGIIFFSKASELNRGDYKGAGPLCRDAENIFWRDAIFHPKHRAKKQER